MAKPRGSDGQAARVYARRLYPTAPHFQAAVVNGWHVKARGGSIDDCPYLRRRRDGGWGGPWRQAWLAGFAECRRRLGRYSPSSRPGDLGQRPGGTDAR